MDEARVGVIGVWRVGPSGRLGGYVLAGVPAVGAVSAWLSELTHPDARGLVSAGVATAVAAGFGLFSWWKLSRVRLELTTQGIIMVNPWGTQRLAWSRVSAVTLGNWGARFHTADGFKFTAFALSALAGAGAQDGRFAEVQRAVRSQLPD